MVVAAPAAGFDKAEAAVEGQGWVVGSAEFENQLDDSGGAKFGGQGEKKLPSQAVALKFGGNCDRLKLGLGRDEAGDCKARDDTGVGRLGD
jgi:hypothetical protein